VPEHTLDAIALLLEVPSDNQNSAILAPLMIQATAESRKPLQIQQLIEFGP